MSGRARSSGGSVCTTLPSAGSDHRVLLWDARFEQPPEALTPEGHDDLVISANYSPDALVAIPEEKAKASVPDSSAATQRS